METRDPRSYYLKAAQSAYAHYLYTGSIIQVLMGVVNLEAGEVVFKEGDPGEELFVIVEGKVEVQKLVTSRYHGRSDKGEMKVLAEYNDRSDRSWFGELALWNARPRAASAQMALVHRPTSNKPSARPVRGLSARTGCGNSPR